MRLLDKFVKKSFIHYHFFRSISVTGSKELTDINALANGYLLLTYYSLRSKDGFNNLLICMEGFMVTKIATLIF